MMHINHFIKILVLLLLFSINVLKPYQPFVWVSTLNDNRSMDKELYLHALVSFVQAIKFRTDESPIDAVLLYDGNDKTFMDTVKSVFDVHIIQTRFSLIDTQEFQNREENWKRAASGPYLRLDACNHLKAAGFHNPYALYTDNDVIFLHDPRPVLETLKPKTFCVVSELYHKRSNFFHPVHSYNFFNSGVIWMNTEFMRCSASSLFEFIRAHNFSFPSLFSRWEQAALQAYYKDQWEELPDLMNWLIWIWEGINDNAIIIHFSGPKPIHIEKYLKWLDSHPNTNKISAERASVISNWHIKLFREYSPRYLHRILTLFKQYDIPKNL